MGLEATGPTTMDLTCNNSPVSAPANTTRDTKSVKLIWQFTPSNRWHETQPVPQTWSLENPPRLKGLDKVVHGVVENLDLLQHFFFEHFNRREELDLD